LRYDHMLINRKALITAGASRIGRACALLFATHGASVAIADLDEEAGTRLRLQLQTIDAGCRFYHVDLCCKDSVKSLCDRYLSDFGAPDIWLNCAGVCRPAFIDEQEEAAMEEMLNLNLLSAFRVMKHLAGPMKEKRRGSIIQVVSDYSVTGGNGVSAYGASKGGLLAMTNSFAMDYAPYGIRVNSILPGVSIASMGDRIEEEMGAEAASAYWFHTQMLPRRGCVEEVADAALFLASDMSGLVTAEALFVNGGQNIIAHSQPYRENWSEGQ
jgi:NAD(P)-dependent dehydrogenase (short-subunit alcohol dehydrogenase family)